MRLMPAIAAHQSFWSSTLALALVVAVCAGVVGLTVAIVLFRRSRTGSVRDRVGEFVTAGDAHAGEGASELLPPSRVLTRTERSLEHERWWAEFKEKLEIGRVDRPAIEIVYLTVAGAVVGAFLLAALTVNPAVGLLGLIVVPLATRNIVNRQVRRQRILFGEQLPSHLQELAAAMRAGHSMISGIGVMAEGASEPTRGEFQRVMADEQLGMPLEEALRMVSTRMEARDMEQVSLVAELHRQTGGNMAEVLDRVAEAVRARAELNRELRTLTAQARGSRWIVTLIPPILLSLIYLLNPTYLEPLFSTGVGHLLLAFAVGLMCIGSWVMGRIVRIEA